MTAPALSPQDLQAIASAAPQWRGGNVAVVQTPHAGRVVVKSMRAPRHPARYRLLGALAGLLGACRSEPQHERAETMKLATIHSELNLWNTRIVCNLLRSEGMAATLLGEHHLDFFFVYINPSKRPRISMPTCTWATSW